MTSLPVPLCIVMESAINGVFTLDENYKDNAKHLSGKTIKIELIDLGVCFFICVSSQHRILVLSYSEDPDVLIRGTSVNLAKMSTMDDANRMVLSREVSISGDVGTVSQVQEFFASINIDWEEHLARLIGDLPAHKIGTGLRDGVAWLRQSMKSLAQDVSEYARYESEWLPNQYEDDDFTAQVNMLRNDVDRFEAKLKRLLHKIELQKTKPG